MCLNSATLCRAKAMSAKWSTVETIKICIDRMYCAVTLWDFSGS